MCGKSVLRSIDAVAHEAGAMYREEDLHLFTDGGHVGPGNKAPVILMIKEKLYIMPYFWGYHIQYNSWDYPKVKLTYNARSETFRDKPSFKDNKRCIIPVASFYEGGKQFIPTKSVALYLAGLARNGKFVMLTQDAKLTQVSHYYHRAPVVLNLGQSKINWLGEGVLPNLSYSEDLSMHESLYRAA